MTQVLLLIVGLVVIRILAHWSKRPPSMSRQWLEDFKNQRPSTVDHRRWDWSSWDRKW